MWLGMLRWPPAGGQSRCVANPAVRAAAVPSKPGSMVLHPVPPAASTVPGLQHVIPYGKQYVP